MLCEFWSEILSGFQVQYYMFVIYTYSVNIRSPNRTHKSGLSRQNLWPYSRVKQALSVFFSDIFKVDRARSSYHWRCG